MQYDPDLSTAMQAIAEARTDEEKQAELKLWAEAMHRFGTKKRNRATARMPQNSIPNKRRKK